jgi:hypothetical protein
MRNMLLFVLLLFMPFWCGCIRFYGHDQYQFKVVDAEQNKPVEGAMVSVYYLFKEPLLNAPKPAEVMTDQSGLAELKVADFHPCLRVKAEGYRTVNWIYIREDVPVQHNFKIKNENEVLVSIYKEPKPTIEIVVPDGYRGPVALEFFPTDKLTLAKAGQRFFSYKMSLDGYVAAPFWPLFHRFKIIARYENGNAVPRARRGSDLTGFSRVYSRDHKSLYFVGRFKEKVELKRELWPEVDGHIRFGGPYDALFYSYFPE